VDDQGHVHYSQTPPPEAGTRAKAAHIDVARADATAAAAYAASVQQSKDAQTKKDQDAADAAKEVDKEAAIREKMAADQAPQREKEAREQYCKSLRSRLYALQHADDGLSEREKGERKYSDDVARQKQIDDAKAQVNSGCD